MLPVEAVSRACSAAASWNEYPTASPRMLPLLSPVSNPARVQVLSYSAAEPVPHMLWPDVLKSSVEVEVTSAAFGGFATPISPHRPLAGRSKYSSSFALPACSQHSG